jgi:hypothetical protein
MQFSNVVSIERPQNEVFDFLADLQNVPKWNYAILETRKVTSGPVAVGSRYRQLRSLPRRSEETLEITELQPGKHLAVRGDLGPFTGTLTYDLEDIEGSTRLTNTADLEGRGIMKIAAPIAGARVRNAVAQNLQTLKGVLEHR